MWMPEYVIIPAKGEIHMEDKNRVPPAFLRPLAHCICFCRYSCADCANRDGPDEDCHRRDREGAMVAACWWRRNGRWPTRRDKQDGNK